jgi:hypothetical protein
MDDIRNFNSDRFCRIGLVVRAPVLHTGDRRFEPAIRHIPLTLSLDVKSCFSFCALRSIATTKEVDNKTLRDSVLFSAPVDRTDHTH